VFDRSDPLSLVHKLPHLLYDPALTTANLNLAIFDFDLALTDELTFSFTLLLEITTLAFVVVPLGIYVIKRLT
jgi:hypothetical protein